MNTYLVADGGGTKTEFLWFREDGTVLATARAGGSNAVFIPPEKAAANVRHGIRSCLAAVPEQTPPRTVLLFIPGFAGALDILRAAPDMHDIRLMDDFWNAFYGALGVSCGIVALAGTGSFVAGRQKDGPLVTVGGWGPMFGDEGSGYRLGVLCLKAVTRRYDEGKPGGILTEHLLRYMGIEKVLDLQTAAYRPSFTREHVTRLSFVVEQAAREGDGEAAKLFDILAAELVEQVCCLAARLGGGALPVSATGGMLKAGAWFSGAFERALARRAPELTYAPPKYNPLLGGALYLMAEQQGVDLADGRLAARLAHGLAQAQKARL